MFKFNAARINFIPAVGDKLIVSGKVSLYAPTGAYQIQVSNIRKSGEGELEAAFADGVGCLGPGGFIPGGDRVNQLSVSERVPYASGNVWRGHPGL